MQSQTDSEKCGGRTCPAATCGQRRKAALFTENTAAGRTCSLGKCGQALRQGKIKKTDPKNTQIFQKIKPWSDNSQYSKINYPTEDWKALRKPKRERKLGRKDTQVSLPSGVANSVVTKYVTVDTQL